MKSWISSYHCIVLEVYQDSKVSAQRKFVVGKF